LTLGELCKHDEFALTAIARAASHERALEAQPEVPVVHAHIRTNTLTLAITS
jgi:hypothetical protein